MRGADLRRDLDLHQLARDQRDRLTHETAVLAREHIGNDISDRHPLRHGPRGAPPIDTGVNRRVWNPQSPDYPRPAPAGTATPLLPTTAGCSGSGASRCGRAPSLAEADDAATARSVKSAASTGT